MAILRAAAVFIVVMFAADFVLSPRFEKGVEQAKNLEQMKSEYIFRKWQATNLTAVRAQQREAEALLKLVSATLPTTFDGDFEQVANAAQRHRVHLEQSAPSQETIREFYSERGIRITATGRYHDLGAFAAAISNARNCLRLQDLNITASSGNVKMEATVRAYRYLDDAEAEKQRKHAAARKKS
jgi:type IV pilus assembly protein PilO